MPAAELRRRRTNNSRKTLSETTGVRQRQSIDEILNSMCDDFENVDQVILREVARVAAKCGATIERPEFVENLRRW
jgi:hypothetical protein